MKTCREVVAEIYSEERIAGLLVRYWGLGTKLNDAEKEMLLVALDEENKALQGPLHQRALERLKELGVS